MTMPAQTPSSESTVDTDRLGEEAAASGAAMSDARLGGQEGTGTLQVVRGQNGDVLEIRGTWRSKDDAAADDGALARLCEAMAAGETVRYRGPLVDPASDRDRLDVDVEFTSSNRYTFTGEDDRSGHDRRIFNFRPAAGEGALRG